MQAKSAQDLPMVEVLERQPAVALTKLAPPKPPPRMVATARFCAWRDAILAHQLTLVRGPSGFGKTACCAEWYRTISRRGAVVAWASFDPDDNYAGRAVSCILAAIDRAAPEIAPEALALVTCESMAPTQTLAALLINGVIASNQEVVLFLDDFHRLSEPGALQFISYVLLHCPANLHFVIACQARPRLPIARLSASDSVQVLDSDDLRLRRDEAYALLKDHPSLLSDTQIDVLQGAMGGWVTGLKIAAAALRHDRHALAAEGAVARGARWLADYLGESVFDRLPATVQQFLMRCSIVESQTVALCERLAPGQGAAETLQWLADQNLFVQPLDDGETFRLHPVFRAFLQDRLRRTLPEEMQRLHRVAATHYARARQTSQAIRHAIAGGDAGQAAEWIEDAAMAMIERFNSTAVLDWIAMLPDGAGTGRIKLRIAQAWALTLSGRPQAVPLIEELRASVHPSASPAARAYAQELTSIRSIFAGLYEDDTGLAVRLAEDYTRFGQGAGSFASGTMRNTFGYGLMQRGDYHAARSYLSRSDAGPRADDEVVEAYRHCIGGLASRRQGLLGEAERLFRAGLTRSERQVGASSASAALNACLLAESLYERDDIVGAGAMLADRFPQIRECSFAESVIAAYRVAVSVRLMAGDVALATSLLDEAELIGHERGWSRLLAVTIVLRLRAGLSLTVYPEQLLPMSAEDSTLQEPLSRGARTFTILAEAFWLQAWQANDLVRCGEIASRAARQAVETASTPDVLRWRMLEARLADRRGDRSASMLELRRCLPEIVRHGFVRMAIDTVPRVSWKQALHAPAAEPLDQASLHRLQCLATPQLFIVKSRSSDLIHDTSLFGLLTAREIDVLIYLAANLTNKEIARHLHLTPETVKWHLKNILRKLDCRSRAGAVARAIELGLISRPHAVQTASSPYGE